MEALSAAVERAGAQVTTTPTSSARSGWAGADIVVVDSYLVRADELSRGAFFIAAVDDLLRDLAVDVVVDPAPGARPQDHPRAGLVLAGARYGLLGPGDVTVAPTDSGGEVRSVLVTTGAADVAGAGMHLAACLREALPDVAIRLVVGPWSGTDPPRGVQAVVAPDDLWDALSAADVVVTAGGVTMLESLRSGRPTVVVMTAENQRRQIEGALALGAVRVAQPEEVAATVLDLVVDGDERARLAAAGADLIDGRGPDRVAAALLRAWARR